MGAEAVSHADILAELGSLRAEVRSVKGDVDRVRLALGTEGHDEKTGQFYSTGLYARIALGERRDQEEAIRRLQWRNRALGYAAAAATCVAIVMFFAGDRVDNVKTLVRSAPPAAAEPVDHKAKP